MSRYQVTVEIEIISYANSPEEAQQKAASYFTIQHHFSNVKCTSVVELAAPIEEQLKVFDERKAPGA